MFVDHPDHLTMSLFTREGERKYLNQRERKRFYKALSILDKPCERTFCETIFWTGCRPSEALELDYMRVNIEDAFLVFRTLKKRGANRGKHFRIVPIPRKFAKALDTAHKVTTLQKQKQANLLTCLWSFGRQTGWRIIKLVMERAKIFGIRATARGLRHSFGVHAILCSVPETTLQTWMGHASLKTTAIYVGIVGAEDRAIAKRMWNQEAYAT